MLKLQIDQRQLAKLKISTVEALTEIAHSSKLMSDLSEAVIDDVKFQTRRGISIPLKGQRFRPLSEKWKELRDRIAEVETVSDVYAKARSNLSLTGQLLNSLRFRIKRPGLSTIYFDGVHQPYSYRYLDFWKRNPARGRSQIVRSSKSGTTTTGKHLRNEDLARYVSEQGRPFLGLRETLKPRLLNMVRAQIRRVLADNRR